MSLTGSPFPPREKPWELSCTVLFCLTLCRPVGGRGRDAGKVMLFLLSALTCANSFVYFLQRGMGTSPPESWALLKASLSIGDRPLRVLQAPQDLGDGSTAGPQSPAVPTAGTKVCLPMARRTAGQDPSRVPCMQGWFPRLPQRHHMFTGGC